MKQILYFVLFIFVCTFIGAAGLLGLHYVGVRLAQNALFVPQAVTFDLAAPEKSLTASLTVLSGTVTHLPRSSTASATIAASATLIQGDGIKTDATSSALVVFDQVAELKVGAAVNLQFVDTVPGEILLWQQDGTVEYVSTQSAVPVTVRSLSLLTTLSSTSATISVNQPAGNVITLIAGSAPVTVAYQDTQANTHVVNIPAQTTAVYNHPKRLLTLKTPAKPASPLNSLLRKKN